MKHANASFFTLSKQTINLLPAREAVKAWRQIGASVFLSLLEAISLAAFLPLIYLLVTPEDQPMSLLFPDALRPLQSLPWSSAILFVVCIFLFKNSMASWLVHQQLTFVNRLYISFTEKVYQNFYRQTWADYVQTNSADTFRKIRNTAFDFTHYVFNGYLLLISDILICLMTVGILAWLDYRIVFIALALSVPVIVFYYVIRKKIILKIDRSFRDLTPKANMQLAHGIDSFAETKIYGKEHFFIDRFIRLCRTTSRQLTNLKTVTSFPPRLLETLGIIFFAGCIIYAKRFPDTRQELLVLLGLLSLAMYKIIPSFNRMLINISQIQAYGYAVTELQGYLKPRHKTVADEQHQALTFDKTIRLKNIHYQYPTASTPVLQNINIHINKGDFVVLTGPSGVGKTTLMHLLTGLIEDYKGDIFIDETVLSNTNLQVWQKKIGLVPQSPVILQDTVIQNVAFGEEAEQVDLPRLKSALELSGLDAIINGLPLKLKTSIGEKGLTLSGGQRQRLMLARALYRDPEVLLLDEVTNHLDEENKLHILNTLLSLTKNGRTIIMVSHDAIVRTFATKVLCLKKDRVEELHVSLPD